jgi:hypothetical protein
MLDNHLHALHSRQGGPPLAGARLAGFCLVLLLLLACAPPAKGGTEEHLAAAAPLAAPAEIAQTPVFAILGIKQYLLTLNNRANIVRFCMCVMALALFIMMKK